MITKKIALCAFLSTIISIKANELQSDDCLNNNSAEQMHNNLEECKKIHGKELVPCIHALTSEEQKQLLKELTPTHRKEYLLWLTLAGYDKFLDNYNEYDWARLHKQLTKEEQTYWPKTIQQQRISIANIKNHTQHGSPRYQTFAFIVDLLPNGKDVRRDLEKVLDPDETPLPEKIEKNFDKYMKETFKI